MTEFYYLHFLDRPASPVAYGIDDPERDRLLLEPGKVDNWSAVELSTVSRDPTDYLANNLALRLCSTKMRGVIESSRGPEDNVQWLEATVTDASGRKHDYHVIHVLDYPDVLDHSRTIWAAADLIVKAVLSRDRAGAYRVFSIPGGSPRLIVAGEVRSAVIHARCTGVDFAPVAST